MLLALVMRGTCSPSFLPFKGGSDGPPRDMDTFFLVCESLIVFAALEPEKTDCPPISVIFWHNPNYELVRLFLTELKFLDRN